MLESGISARAAPYNFCRWITGNMQANRLRTLFMRRVHAALRAFAPDIMSGRQRHKPLIVRCCPRKYTAAHRGFQFLGHIPHNYNAAFRTECDFAPRGRARFGCAETCLRAACRPPPRAAARRRELPQAARGAPAQICCIPEARRLSEWVGAAA